MRKQIGIKVYFEGEYTEKETQALWGRFFECLARLDEKNNVLEKIERRENTCKIY